MSENISAFVMQSHYCSETIAKARLRRPIAGPDVRVVAVPLGESALHQELHSNRKTTTGLFQNFKQWLNSATDNN